MVRPRVFIAPVASRATEQDIEEFFHGYGTIESVLLKDRFAVVEFTDHRDADKAISDLNGKTLLDQQVKVEMTRAAARGRGYQAYAGGSNSQTRGSNPPIRTNYRLIVKNLTTRIQWKALKEMMGEVGEVTYANAHNRRRHEGVVEFASYSDMKNAIRRLHDTKINGRRIQLEEDDKAKFQRDESSSRGSYRSRKRSLSRHNSSRSNSRSVSREPRKKVRSSEEYN